MCKKRNSGGEWILKYKQLQIYRSWNGLSLCAVRGQTASSQPNQSLINNFYGLKSFSKENNGCFYYALYSFFMKQLISRHDWLNWLVAAQTQLRMHLSDFNSIQKFSG